MAIGDLIKSTDIQAKYTAYLSGYTNYVWSLSNYPSLFPTAYLGSSIVQNLPRPNPGDIITAFNSIANAVKTTAKALTSIVTCRYVLKYNDNGVWRVDYDQTQKALFNSGYLLNLTSNINVGEIVFESTLNNFYASIRNEVIAAQNRLIYLESTYCHSSCFSLDTKLKLKYQGENVILSFKEFEEKLDNTEIDDYLIETPEGYANIVELFYNGVKDVFLINEEIECTIDHKFIVNKQSNEKIEIGYLLGKEVEIINGKRKIESIRYIGKKEVYDLEVYANEHRYVVNDYIVSNCHSSCFSGNTLLNVMYKDKEIEISFSELVHTILTKNSKNDYKILTPEGYKNIIQIYINGIKDIYHINNEIKCTIDHEFIVDKKTNKKVKIESLLGKEVETINGKRKIDSILKLEKEIVYDLEVDSDEHRYIVNDYIVANCHGCLLPEKSFIEIELNGEYSKVSLLDLKEICKFNTNVKALTPDGYSLITNYFNQGKKLIYKVKFENSEIYCTLDHKIFIDKTTSKPLKDLIIGDEILTKEGKDIFKFKEEFGIFETVDIEVNNVNHNFYCNKALISNSRGRR